MFSKTMLMIIGGTCISLLCICALWFISLLGLSFAGISFRAHTQYLIPAIHFFIILVFDILIITKAIDISPSSITLGYIILIVGVWIIVCLVFTAWTSTTVPRTKLLYEKVTQQGEYIVDYYGSINQLCGYYYYNQKVYFVEKREDQPYYLVSIHPKIKNIDTNKYVELYEQSNKFTLLFKKSDAGNHYPNCIMHLNGAGLYAFNWIEDLARTENFSSLNLIILDEEVHTMLKEL